MPGPTSRIMQLARFTPAQHLLLCIQQSKIHINRLGWGNTTSSRTWRLDYRTGLTQGLTQDKARRPSCIPAYQHNFSSPPSILAQAIAKMATEAFAEDDGKGIVQIPVAQEETKPSTGEIKVESTTARGESTMPPLPPRLEDTVDCDKTSQSPPTELHFRSDCPVPDTTAEHTTNLPAGFPERSDDEPTAPSGFECEIINIDHELLPTGSATSPTNSALTNSPSMGMLNGVQNVNVTSCNFYQAAGDQYSMSNLPGTLPFLRS
ncbi:hypothetical protein ONZ45_g16561 [Pleurotus djamor]|nr:hypothetical protein ONZ45_g16561 [Pleurotus djamor]